MLPKKRAYRSEFDETKYMSFFIKKDELLEKYDKIWDKVNNIIRFDCGPVYNEKYIKAKPKSYEGKTNTNFHDDNLPKKRFQYIHLSVILMTANFRTGENYYPPLFLEEYKYFVKEKRYLNIVLKI